MPSLGGLPDPGIKPRSAALWVASLLPEPLEKRHSLVPEGFKDGEASSRVENE